MAARSREKALAAIAELKTETGKKTHFSELDLGSLASVREAAAELLSKEEALYNLFQRRVNGLAMFVPTMLMTDRVERFLSGT